MGQQQVLKIFTNKDGITFFSKMGRLKHGQFGGGQLRAVTNKSESSQNEGNI